MQVPRQSRRQVLSALTGTVSLAALAACAPTGGASVRWEGSGSGASAEPDSSSQIPGDFAVTPATDTADVSVLDPITVTAKDAALTTVTVTTSDGKAVEGEWDSAKSSWKSTTTLRYDTEYSVVAAGTDSAGQPLERKSTFRTLKPKKQAVPILRANYAHQLKERSSYGVGQPVIVYFDTKITDKAAAERQLEVTTEPAVEGAWRWISAQEVHYRPEKYWASGTRITVKANVFGQKLGEGVYGKADASVTFTIGQSRIAIADAETKRMQVFIDGEMVRDIPVSLGKGGNVTGQNGRKINYWTNSGPHIVIEKTPSTRMTSSSYGLTDPKDPNYYDELVKLTVRISSSGEFVHLADWNIPAHGRRNTSHGCINVGPAHAQWFYDNFVPGDVVDVKGTPVKLGLTNGLGDWTMSWDEWRKGSAL